MLACRRRRIKCGEEKPVCKNCKKSNRVCEGYAPRVAFKPHLSTGNPGTFNADQPTPAWKQTLGNYHGLVPVDGMYAEAPRRQLEILTPSPADSDVVRGPIHSGSERADIPRVSLPTEHGQVGFSFPRNSCPGPGDAVAADSSGLRPHPDPPLFQSQAPRAVPEVSTVCVFPEQLEILAFSDGIEYSIRVSPVVRFRIFSPPGIQEA